MSRSMVVARPAIERNTGRTLTKAPPGVTITEVGDPVSATATRVLAGLTGLWLAQGPGCRPDFAKHQASCPHAADWYGTTLRRLARETFGRDDGTATAQAHRALRELASTASQVLIFDTATGAYGEEVSTVGSLQVLGYRGHPHATVRWAWAVPIRERLMAGDYQRLPSAIVKGLRGTDWRIVSWLLQHPGLAAMRTAGRRSFELRPGAKDRQRFGLASLDRPWRIRNAYERAARAGNDLQERDHIAVLDAASGGLKFRLTPAVKAVTSPETAWAQYPNRVDPTPQPRYFDTAIPLEMTPPDSFRTRFKTTDDGDLSSKAEPSLRSGNDDRGERTGPATDASLRAAAIEAALQASSPLWQTTPKQRGLIEAIESRGIKAGCSLNEHLGWIDEGIRDYRWHFEEREHDQQVENNSLSFLIDHDDQVHPRVLRPVADVTAYAPIRDAAWEQRTRDRLRMEAAWWRQELAREQTA